VLAIGFGAAALGKRFRVYSIATILFLPVGGAMAGKDTARVGDDLPTPWMGLWELFNIYATMLWIAVLAIAVLCVQSDNSRREDRETIITPSTRARAHTART